MACLQRGAKRFYAKHIAPTELLGKPGRMKQRTCSMCVGFMVILLFSITGMTYAEHVEVINFVHYYYTPPASLGIENVVTVINREHPEFQVQPARFEQEAFKVTIKAMLAGGNPPDTFSYWAGARTQALVDAGYLEPLDDLWEQARLDERFAPAVARVCTYNGQKYLAPLSQYYVAFFYNTQIFKTHGIAIPHTWEEFLHVCRQLKAAGVTPVALGAQDKWPAQFWFDYLLLRTAGPEYRQRLMTGDASYTDPEVRRAYELWRDLLAQDFFIPHPELYRWYDAAKMVFQGQAAMILMGNWISFLFDGALGWKQQQDYDFFPFPVIDPAVPGVSLGPIDGLLLPRNRKVQTAKTVLPYFSEIAPQQEMSRVNGSLSPNMTMPLSFYTDLQQRMLITIKETPYWAFNYDLATPPLVAEIGLNSFVEFLKQPEQYLTILEETESQAKQRFQGQ